MSAAGVVLCGGRSSRMGRAKAWLPWRGRPMLAHVVDVLREVVDEVVVVSAPDVEVPPTQARVVLDREPGLGPLGGIREGLLAIRAERAFVTSTDAPLLTPRFVRAMLAFEGAAAPEVDGFVQTLCAVYPRRLACEADRLISEGRMRPLFLLEAAGFRHVRPDELPDVEALRGLNTPELYLEAVRCAEPGATATLELLGQARRRVGRSAVSVAVGTLGEVWARGAPELGACQGGEIPREYLVSLDGRTFVRDARVPIGPGEHVIVMDAAAGG
jgi:molybdopterin-guanine dinucleotide biosynthesis protein A